ncbi:MAG: ribose 5-phosphate isomerase B [Chloroflexi bacterium]|nr:ribose 5-phosphate isomerase B [Chloroflexota bacterium]
MKVAIGADHAGFELKQALIPYLEQQGHLALDLGTHSQEPTDYPDYAEAVANALLRKQAERGILICGSGVGASVAANKIPGIRAGLCHDSYSAHQGVEHDNMNILVLGAWVIGSELAREFVSRFLQANFSGEERHLRRLNKIRELELRYLAKQKKEE